MSRIQTYLPEGILSRQLGGLIELVLSFCLVFRHSFATSCNPH
jgi:hypothetical protein